MVATGNVVMQFNVGKVRVKICDDYCRDKTPEDVKEILKKIARQAIGPLSAAAAEKSYEKS